MTGHWLCLFLSYELSFCFKLLKTAYIRYFRNNQWTDSCLLLNMYVYQYMFVCLKDQIQFFAYIFGDHPKMKLMSLFTHHHVVPCMTSFHSTNTKRHIKHKINLIIVHMMFVLFSKSYKVTK